MVVKHCIYISKPYIQIGVSPVLTPISILILSSTWNANLKSLGLKLDSPFIIIARFLTTQEAQKSIGENNPNTMNLSYNLLWMGSSVYKDFVRFMASRASFSIRLSSSAQVGISWINPMT